MEEQKQDLVQTAMAGAKQVFEQVREADAMATMLLVSLTANLVASVKDFIGWERK